MSRKEVCEIFELAQAAKKPAEVLKEHDCIGLQQMLVLLFNDDMVMNLPDTPPPFIPMDKDLFAESYHRKVKGMGIFIGESRLNAPARERRFLGMLEAIHPKDAALLIAASTKTNKECKEYHVKALYPRVTASQVRKAFPDLLPKKDKS